MSIKHEVISILVESKLIHSAKNRIKLYAKELNKLNPLCVGDELIGNAWSHTGKIFIVDAAYVADKNKENLEYIQNGEAMYFIATGNVKNKDGKMSSYRTTRAVEISEYL